ncbi:TetR family transcriptional regulator [Mycobacterium lentiflavum]|uniref:TetR family transcriptional regulator n=1 Tax=Mycobacterium lentiflavum TaxID=141349 RepID=A0A0E3WCF0_MYCLN|nr:TetR/AcrR family transcriptional regulator [Mycobacterium lentiflavum]MEE3066024.1 TetR/AcrR family transcriptional regulator [Actinomycetota bacterium]ULP44759.1 TetR/AcrR family transcriptional regulator [Mycobacterium lentiflavum]CQD13831.1 TetR family transcriptional regulator [Mycobacterium lentiflavum]
MPSTTPASRTTPVGREAQRLQTRARLFDAAVAEIGRSGLAGTDVAAIAAATGVARGTFYFHFPTKEHILVELERAEETKIVAKLAAKTSGAGDLSSMLQLLIRQVLAAEERLGPVVFRDMLGLHFSATRPIEDETAEHPLAEFVIAAIKQAQSARQVSSDANADELGVIFLTGLFALLVTGGASKTRAGLLDRFVKTIVKGMEPI